MKLFIMLLSVLVLSACSPVSVPPLSTYTLGSTFRASPVYRGHSTKKTVLLNTVIASPGFDTAKMLYVNIPYKLKAFANNAWAAPPAAMLQSLLAYRLRQLHYFSAVVTSPSNGASNFIVSAKLLALQQEFLQPVSQERLAIAVTVVNTQTNRITGERVFQQLVPAPGNDPYSGVLAANKAAQSLAQQIARYVKRVSV